MKRISNKIRDRARKTAGRRNHVFDGRHAGNHIGRASDTFIQTHVNDFFIKQGETGYIFNSIRELYNNIKSGDSILHEGNTSNKVCLWCDNMMNKIYENSSSCNERQYISTVHICKTRGTILNVYENEECDDLWILADGTLC